MRKLFDLIATFATAATLIVASGATAATEVGINCVATSAHVGVTSVPIAYAPSNPLRIAAPSGGAVTKWSNPSDRRRGAAVAAQGTSYGRRAQRLHGRA